MVEDDKYAPSDQKPRKILDSLGLTTKQENLGKQHGGNRVYHINTDQLISVLKSNKYNDLLEKISWIPSLTALQPLTSFTKNGEGGEETEEGEGRSTEQKRNPAQTEEKPAQYEKIQEIRKKIEANRKAGYKITDEFLYDHFDHGLIDGLMRSGQLIKQGNGEFVFGG
jgi:hypothetical protein